ncbi:hypothetical protein L1049_018318 [Liquidambar formosana]|uniref:Cytochrome P450 n=1 Tax=Liquidambar formosana TaxID=63359 RepID=A0AAP0RA74_LIQFO
MEVATTMLISLIISISALLAAALYFITTKINHSSINLPPGSLGWPLLGETLEYLRAAQDGKPERPVEKRMDEHKSPPVFKTWVLGEPIAVFCGPKGNKFLFSNENKLVAQWWPTPMQRLFGSCLLTAVGDEAKRMRRMLMTFLNPDALLRYITTMDVVTHHHITTHWQGKEEVKVYPTMKLYTFELACRLFMSMEDPQHISRIAAQFNVFLKGFTEFPISFPGTRFYRAMKAASAIRKELQVIATHKRAALEQGIVSPSQDLFSHLLATSDENGRFLTEEEIVNNILMLLFAGHDTSSSVITLVMKYLGELPQVYEKVLTEQLHIASSKGHGELLQLEDIQKMSYSWNVVSEVMRISPPVIGGFRESLVDFTYAGYTIPKGWKLHWNAASTHKDPSLFPSKDEFDASRFEGSGPAPFSYVPFGGGPRMCLGKEFARLEILVFLHNVVKRFKWDLLIPDEKIGYDPIAAPAKGLPIRLQPRESKA